MQEPSVPARELGARAAWSYTRPVAGARKVVTVVFADVAGFNALGEALDPEAVRRVIERYVGEARSVLEQHGGKVEKFIGDAVMACFGVPTVHEDDALRAVRAAAEMRERLVLLNEEFAREPGVSLAVRTGVNTGEAIVGDPESGQFFATGDAVNVAARLEQAAQPGEILLGALTHRLVRDAVRAEAVDPLALKGKAEPVEAWRLLEVLPDVPAFTRRLDAPFVGRGMELAVLRASFDRSCQERACELVTVVGAPGIGKSRLARELIADVGEEARVLVGRCLPYGEGITYWPLAEMIGQLVGADVRGGLGELLATEEEGALAEKRIAAALGLVDTPTPSEEIFWAVRLLLEKLARERPLVLLLDDVHWAEPTFLDLLEYVLGFGAGSLFLVCNARPELFHVRPDWSQPRPRTTTLSLTALGEDDAELLVEQLPASAGLAESLRRRIVESAEGNPLFLEQMLALARESGDGEIAVPPTIQALLAERLDRLTAGERLIAEAASVEGRLFHRGTVATLLPEAERESLAAGLVALVRKELIRPDRSEFPGDDGFRFAHVLIRDAAYEGLPKTRRAELHERLAILFESRSSPDELVGYHFEQASLRLSELGFSRARAQSLAGRASDLLAAAGRRASRRDDDRAAANLLRRARALLLPGDQRVPTLGVALADALYSVGELKEAEELSRETMETAAARGDRRAEWLAILQHAWLKGVLDPQSWSDQEIRRTAQAALTAFEELGDDLGLARSWELMTPDDWSACRFDAAAKGLERGLAHARRSEDERTERHLVGSLISALYYGSTPAPEAIARIEELMTQAGGRALEARARALLAGLHTMQGYFEEGRALYERSKAMREELGLTLSLATEAMHAREIHLLAGDNKGAELQLRRGYESLERMGEKGYRSTIAGNLAEALYCQGHYEEAEYFVRVCLEAASPDDLASQLAGRTAKAKLLAVKGRYDQAEQTAREAVALATGTDDLFTLGQAHMALAEVLQLAERREEAIEALEAAAETSNRKGNIVTAGKARAKIAELREPAGSSSQG
jgi:class 3 adenylate cyclase/tetratricopeptide (TPR) repeat protein